MAKSGKRPRALGALKVALAANQELLIFYWDLGKMMSEIAETAVWGKNWLQTLSKDLQDEFPEMVGFSQTNL